MRFSRDRDKSGRQKWINENPVRENPVGEKSSR